MELLMDYSVVTEFQKPIFENAKFPFTVHIDTLSTSYQVLTHWHSEIEILYFQSGECYAHCDQTKVHCHAGEILFCNSYCFHGLEQIVPSCTYICYFFSPEMLSQKIKPFIPKQSFIQVKEINLQRILGNIKDEFYLKKEESQTVMRYEMNLFHLYLHRIISEDDASLIKYKGHDSTESNTRQDKLLQKALIYISEHLNENISLKEVCSHCGLSVSRFSILFKQYTGKTTIDYINISRCRLAYSFYVDNGYTVSESARSAGFENLSYFSRKFKEIYGCTLSEIHR